MNAPANVPPPAGKIVKTDAEWRAQLTPEQYQVTRHGGTECAFTGALWDDHRDGIDVLIVMGGAMNVDEEARHPWLADEKRFLRTAIDAGKPVLGICLGGQLIADVLGARVSRNRERELGWFDVTLTAEGRASRARSLCRLRKGAGHQLDFAVQFGSHAMHRADKRSWPTAHHPHA